MFSVKKLVFLSKPGHCIKLIQVVTINTWNFPLYFRKLICFASVNTFQGPKQYTVDEFRSLKKKMQAQGKVLLGTM